MVVIRLIIQNNKGFSAIEALVGFVLLSSMMLLYLPSLTQNIYRFQMVQESSNQWAVFETLVKFNDSKHLSSTIERYNQNTTIKILDFYQDDWSASITFADGTEYFIGLTDLY